jgi:hypothetical protein
VYVPSAIAGGTTAGRQNRCPEQPPQSRALCHSFLLAGSTPGRRDSSSEARRCETNETIQDRNILARPRLSTRILDSCAILLARPAPASPGLRISPSRIITGTSRVAGRGGGRSPVTHATFKYSITSNILINWQRTQSRRLHGPRAASVVLAPPPSSPCFHSKCSAFHLIRPSFCQFRRDSEASMICSLRRDRLSWISSFALVIVSIMARRWSKTEESFNYLLNTLPASHEVGGIDKWSTARWES